MKITPAKLPLDLTLHEMELNYILQVLESHNWNRTHAAKALGLCRRSIGHKVAEIRSFGITVPKSTSMGGKRKSLESHIASHLMKSYKAS